MEFNIISFNKIKNIFTRKMFCYKIDYEKTNFEDFLRIIKILLGCK